MSLSRFQNRTRSILGMIVAAAVISAGVVLSPTAAFADAPGAIEGTIHGPGGTVVESASVELFTPAGQSVDMQSSDEEGFFHFGELDEGSYKIRIHASGYLGYWWSGKKTLGSATLIPVSWAATTQIAPVLSRGASISGTLTKAGSPLAGVEVWAYDESSGSEGSGTSREDGSYTISGLKPGTYGVSTYRYSGDDGCYSAGALAAPVTLVPSQSVTGKIITVTGCGTVSGVVKNAANVGIEGVRVYVDYNLYATTSSSGAYSVPDVPAAQYRVQFVPDSPAYAMEYWNNKKSWAASDRLAVVSDTTVIANATLEASATISGRVTNTAGEGIGGITVRAYDSEFYQWGVTTEEDGTYTISGATPGSFRLQFSDYSNVYSGEYWNNKSTLSTATVFTVAAGATSSGKNAVLDGSAIVTGTIFDGGEPGVGLADTWLIAVDKDGTQVAYTSPDSDGTFELTGVPATSITLYARGDSYHVGSYLGGSEFETGAVFFTPVPNATTSGKNLTLPLGGSISGVLTDPQGDPADNARIAAYKKSGSAYVFVTSGSSDGLGGYYLPGLGSGTYKLSFGDFSTGSGFVPGETYKTEYWNNAATLAAATGFAVSAGGSVTDKNAQLDYRAAAPALTSPVPTVTGTLAVGSTLTATSGTWGPATVTLAYQWKRGGVDIAGATSSSYLLTTEDAGAAITVAVTGSREGYSSVTRTSVAKVIGRVLETSLPTITGSPTVGTKLAATTGTWGPTPVTFTYQWKRAGVAIAGATLATYTPVAADADKALTVTVTGTKATYTTVVRTSDAVTIGRAFTGGVVPTIAGVPTAGVELTGVPGTYGPAPVEITYQWLRNGTVIMGEPTLTYIPSVADAGAAISFRVTVEKPGYTTVVRTSEAKTIGLPFNETGTPSVSGERTVGATLQSDYGTWYPQPEAVTYQWKRSGTAIAGATAESYTLKPADAGKVISLTITATKPNYTPVVKTATAGTIGLAISSSIPVITGTPTPGQKLTAVPGVWGPAPVTLAYQWFSDDAPISGASKSTYTLTAGDVPAQISVRVTGTKPGFTADSRWSESTRSGYAFTAAPVPTLSAAPTLGVPLGFTTGTWTPTPWEYTYQWKRAGVAIPGAVDELYTPLAADLGKALTLTVSAHRPDYVSTSKTSVAKIVTRPLVAAPSPSISGTPAVGSKLTAVPGTWAPAPVALAYAWLRNGTPITGATAASYTLVTADAGATITVKVTGTKAGYTSASTTATTVVQLLLTAPTPRIAGVASLGSVIEVDASGWTAGTDLTVQWKRAGVAIPGETGEIYAIVEADLGKVITVTVTGTKEGYTAAARTSAAVLAGNALTAGEPTIVGDAAVGLTVTAQPGTWAPAPVTFAYAWFRGDEQIVGATAKTYKFVAADAGETIAVRVTGSKAGYASNSAYGYTVVAGLLQPGTVTVQGTPTVGNELSTDAGTWIPGDVDFEFQWKRAGAAIPGETGSGYTLVAADAGKLISVAVSATHEGYSPLTRTSAGVLAGAAFTATPFPTITGTPATGSVLTAVPGTWGPAPVTFTYKWLRGNTVIPGATAKTYTLVAADAGQQVRVFVTGSKAGYTSVTLEGSRDIQNRLLAPLPLIGGSTTVGETLTALTGWSPDPSLSYQWKRNGTAIEGAITSGYIVQSADAGKSLTVTVTGVLEGYTTEVKTSPARPVALAFASSAAPVVSGNSNVGTVLTATTAAWTPAPVLLTYQWLRNDVAIAGATKSTYTTIAADLGTSVTVRVTGSKAGYTTKSVSGNATTVVAAITGPAPTISGSAAVGETVTTGLPGWTPAGLLVVDYQWTRAGVAIPGAVESSYTLTPSDAGKQIAVRVTAASSGRDSVTKTTAAIVPFSAAPVPVLSGGAVVGTPLTVAASTWGPSGVSLAYQWLRNGSPIAGATSAAYTPTEADWQYSLSVRVTGTKVGYTAVVRTSSTTYTVKQLEATPRPIVTGSTAQNQQVTVFTGEWSPWVDLSFQWNVNGVPISGATSTNFLATYAVGSYVTVTVTATANGYLTASRTSPAIIITP